MFDVLALTNFHCCSWFSDLPTTAPPEVVSTSTVSHTDGTTTIATVPGSANDTTEVVPKAVPEATITTPSLHLPSTTSILIDSEMTTGNSNLSQHCKWMRFLSFFCIPVPHALVGDLTSCLSCRGVRCRHTLVHSRTHQLLSLGWDGCCHSSHLPCQGICISFYPRHMNSPESSHQPLPCTQCCLIPASVLQTVEWKILQVLHLF